MKPYLQPLKQHFPEIKQLKDFQQVSIEHLLEGKNQLTIVPTGKGKSLIFQLAALAMPGMTIVVSPLIALMREQVKFLKEKGIYAEMLGGNFKQQRALLRSFSSNPPKLLYVSPERLQNFFFRAALKHSKTSIPLIAIDEAHSISQWGIQFRPEYDRIPSFLAFLKEIGQKPVLLGLTATLGQSAQADICKSFGILEEHVFIHNEIVREELHLHFEQFEVADETKKKDRIRELLLDQRHQKILIYFYQRRKCEKIANWINSKLDASGRHADYFHAKRFNKDKDAVYKQFKAGTTNVLCATSAFGMGMNIPDIDTVIFYHLPFSVEEFYQMAGRAARKKDLYADCYLLWSEKNFEHKRKKQIPEGQYGVEDFQKAFKRLGLAGQKGKEVFKQWNDLIGQDLHHFKVLFEKHGVLQTIGELNGIPKDVQLKKPQPEWDLLLSKSKRHLDWIQLADNGNRELQAVIDWVWQQELKGNIKELDPDGKKIFYRSNYNSLPLSKVFALAEEAEKITQFRIEQINLLYQLVRSKDQSNDFIQKLLGPPLNSKS